MITFLSLPTIFKFRCLYSTVEHPEINYAEACYKSAVKSVECRSDQNQTPKYICITTHCLLTVGSERDVVSIYVSTNVNRHVGACI